MVNVLKTLGQIVVFWGFFLYLLPLVILKVETYLGIPNFALPSWVGWTLFGLVGSVGFGCAMIFAILGSGTPLPLDTTTKLIIRGPYRFIRNPMAVAGITQGVAVGLVFGSWAVVGYALLGALFWHYLARPWEEADLRTRFGKPYLDYEKSVPLWYPRLTPYASVTSPGEPKPIQDSSAQTGHATPDDETPA